MALFIDIILAYIIGLLNTLEGTLETLDLSMLNTFLDILGTVLYFFPWQYVAPILSIIIFLQFYRIIVSILKLIFNFIPFF